MRKYQRKVKGIIRLITQGYYNWQWTGCSILLPYLWEFKTGVTSTMWRAFCVRRYGKILLIYIGLAAHWLQSIIFQKNFTELLTFSRIFGCLVSNLLIILPENLTTWIYQCSRRINRYSAHNERFHINLLNDLLGGRGWWLVKGARVRGPLFFKNFDVRCSVFIIHYWVIEINETSNNEHGIMNIEV